MENKQKKVLSVELNEEELDNVTGGYDMRQERRREVEAPHTIVGDGYGLGEFDGPPGELKHLF